MRSPSPSDDGSPLITVDSGSGLPAFSLMALDACGNRTAPAHSEAWQVRYELFVSAVVMVEVVGGVVVFYISRRSELFAVPPSSVRGDDRY